MTEHHVFTSVVKSPYTFFTITHLENKTVDDFVQRLERLQTKHQEIITENCRVGTQPENSHVKRIGNVFISIAKNFCTLDFLKSN